jgi:hypothetical protein
MKRWKYIPVIAAVILPQIAVVPVSALTVQSDYIIITARVLPTHTIIIDDQGVIQEIISNTTEDVPAPKVFLNTVSKETAQPYTPTVEAQYKQLITPGHGKVGTLYKRPTPLSLLQKPRTTYAAQSRTTAVAHHRPSLMASIISR